MPVKRRSSKRRLDALTLDQVEHLVGWISFFLAEGESPFEDEDHRRAAWRRHREHLLTVWKIPGRRPAAFWDYDVARPADAVGEAEAVYRLPDTTAAERQAIEAHWLQRIEVALLHATSTAAARELAADSWGVPLAFFDRHAPRPVKSIVLETANG